MVLALEGGLPHRWTYTKDAIAGSRMSRAIFTLRLDLVEQALLDQSQGARRRRDALANLDQPHRLLLQFERVARSCRVSRMRSPCLNSNTQQGVSFSGVSSDSQLDKVKLRNIQVDQRYRSNCISMVVARHAEGRVDLLVLDRRLQHHAFGQLAHDVALDLLPRRLAHRVLVAACSFQRDAAL